MAQTNISILVSAVDSASKTFDQISGKLKDMEPAFKAMSVAGTAALGAISGVAYKAVKDYQDVELAQKQLETAVLSVSKGTKQQLADIEALTQALENKGVVDADALKVGAAQLSTFGLTTNMVKNLIPSLADLAVNQYGVNVSAEQFNDTANVMAKALNGQFGVLEKSGIRFTELQQKMITTGTEAERTKAMIEGLRQNLKLTNETARETSAGSLQALQVQLGNISENLGSVLVPALSELLTKVTPVVNKMVEWSNNNPELAAKILAIGAGVAALTAGIGLFGLVLPSIITGISALGTALLFLTANPIGLTIVAIGAIVAAGVALYKHWGEVSAKAKEIWEPIAAFFTKIWESIQNVFTFAIDLIVGLVAIGFEKMGLDITTIWTGISTFLKTTIDGVWAGIRLTTTAFFTAMRTLFATAAPLLKAAWDLIWGGIGDGVTSAFEGVKNIIISAINWVIDKINGWIKTVNEVAAKGASVVGAKAPSINTIPRLADGGIVSRPTLALIGEAGPEAVVPLGKGRSGMGITINITGNTLLDNRAAEKIGDMIIKQLKLSYVL